MALSSLLDRILERVEGVEEFTVRDIKSWFPDENYRKVYRAVAQLHNTQRIRQMRFGANGAVIYSAVGISNLPIFKNKDGRTFPISALLPVMAELHDEHGRLKALAVLDDTWQIVMRLFVTAQNDDQQQIKRDRIYALNEIAEKRGFLMRMVANLDAISQHPAMQNNEEFVRVFLNDPEAPDAEALLDFRRWLAKVQANADERTE